MANSVAPGASFFVISLSLFLCYFFQPFRCLRNTLVIVTYTEHLYQFVKVTTESDSETRFKRTLLVSRVAVCTVLYISNQRSFRVTAISRSTVDIFLSEKLLKRSLRQHAEREKENFVIAKCRWTGSRRAKTETPTYGATYGIADASHGAIRGTMLRDVSRTNGKDN